MKKQSFKRAFTFIIGISLIIWLPCIAESAVEIETARVDFAGGYLYIYGKDFDKGSPIVNLGREALTVSSSNKNTIQTVFPPDTPDGEYLLTVSVGTGPDYNASFRLIIGALGGGGEQDPPDPQDHKDLSESKAHSGQQDHRGYREYRAQKGIRVKQELKDLKGTQVLKDFRGYRVQKATQALKDLRVIKEIQERLELRGRQGQRDQQVQLESQMA